MPKKNKSSPQKLSLPEPPPSLPDPHGGDGQRMLRIVSLILARHQLHGLKRLYEDFERDIMLPMLLGEIAMHNVGIIENGREINLDDSEQFDVHCRLRPCNAYSIAAATGLPRETVRRKIGRLVELGWISKRHNGHLYVSAAAIDRFGELLRSRDLAELVETVDKVRRLYAQAGKNLP